MLAYDVGALDVAVDDALLVEEVEAFEHLQDIDRDERFLQPTKLFYDHLQRAILHKLHDNVEGVGGVERLAVLDNVWILQQLEQLKFLHRHVAFL